MSCPKSTAWNSRSKKPISSFLSFIYLLACGRAAEGVALGDAFCRFCIRLTKHGPDDTMSHIANGKGGT